MIHDDKRRFMRMTVKAEARITELESGRVYRGFCHDLSATGMSVVLDEPLEPNVTVEVYIESSGDMIQPLKAHAKIIRCTQEQDEQWTVGLEITQFN
ncbi:PilZ domain-containing protein [Pseudoalteromonas sp. T1lg65]|uniref:PilZ domain-containing protein n=1 Tax=Pseudoalteromonas sp. T1lg65 TaxID=2077101 RepID=UPI003F79D4C6